MSARPKAVAFNVDPISLVSLREALPGWQIDIIDGATVPSLARTWDSAGADLFVVGIDGEDTAALGLCRLLAFCTSDSKDARQGQVEPTGSDGRRLVRARRTDTPLLVLLSSGQETLIRAVLEAGAHSCLIRPIHPKEVTAMLAHARAGNQPGRHTRNLEGAQQENPWRDAGGEG